MKKLILSFYFMARLSLVDHYSVSVQIDDALADFETENQLLIQARTALHAARLEEDSIYHSYSAKDYTANDLRDAKADLCKYITTIRYSMRGLTYLPDSQAETRRVGELAYQKFTDFDYDSSNGCAACANKLLNMKQEWTAQQTELTTLGIWPWITLASQQAVRVLSLIDQRVQHESERVKGAMIAAREATDDAIKVVYNIINSMNVVSPSNDLTRLTNYLLSVEERAKLYYAPTSSSGDEPEPEPEPTPDPEPEPEPEAVG